MDWIIFNSVILILLVADLFWLYRGHAPKFKSALWGTAFWVGIALLFNAYIYYSRGSHDALAFFTSYLLEYSLSVDNLFVFILIFQAFKIPPAQAHTILIYGIIGAIIMRALMILFGIALVQLFHPILYVFGAFLILASIKLALSKDKIYDPDKNIVVRFAKRCRINRFFLVLIAIESTDLIFALDSIPAVFAITLDPFIVFTSNILAVLGLRSLYFTLSGVMGLFHYLHYGLAGILFFVGTKMVVQPWLAIPIWVSLLVIAILLTISILASLVHKPKQSGK